MKSQHYLYLLILVAIFFIGCTQPDGRTEITSENTVSQPAETKSNLQLDIMTEFPEKIDGCSCYYSKDSLQFAKGEYIYFHNMDSLSIISINGQLEEFQRASSHKTDSTHSTHRYKSGVYSMQVDEGFHRQSGYEVWLMTGVISLEDTLGNHHLESFYGECGC
ncbi:MAG: hypothetical protein Q4F57_08225 [Weeksellaceae bacterium]|nr:hypothetical protein [Weeksellaceae bacterium]